MAKWTEAQQKVIDTRDKNILVSAAAGSGKTAVLVERIINRILDERNPVDIDKILVVTFTNAAASEMRERILKAIDKELEKNPDNEHLQKQQTYIHNASITTIHSFCLNLVREHFDDIDLDPGVRVAEETEIELLKSDVVKEVLEEYYSSGDKEFFRFVGQFESKRSDEYLEKMILDLYGKAMNFPWPDEWLSGCIAKYDYADVEEFEKSIYVNFIMKHVERLLKDILKAYQSIIDEAESNGLDKYVDLFREEAAYIENAIKAEKYDDRKRYLNFEFGRMPIYRNIDSDLKEHIAKIRNANKDSIKKIKESLFRGTLNAAYVEVDNCKDIIRTYVKVTRSFMEKFKEKKRDKNIIDFNDFEHYAIQLLVDNTGGELKETKIADELALEFQEVMVDEYQDSNLVQEIILRSVSKERFNGYNRFMVGDVKQSIYGFRGSNPDIFVEKYNTYSEEETAFDYKIILDKNFRSRQGVIDTTNFMFEQIMNSELGGIDYDEENRLYAGAIYPECENEDYLSRIDDKTEVMLVDTRENEYITEEDTEITEGDEDLSATDSEAEAKAIAKRIRELTDEKNGMVICDKETGEYRPVTFSDIAILYRSIGKNADVIQEEFTKQGIPVFVESRSGYFETWEIKTIINLLKIIDNPIQDLPLAAVLKSPFVKLSDEEIAKVRISMKKKESLYNNICVYVYDKEKAKEKSNKPGLDYDDELSDKLAEFLKMLNEFRDKAIYLSIYELINDILDKTGFLTYVSAMPSGKQRIANVEMLKQKAEDYETGSYKGLFNFVRYVEKMKKYNIDMGEASILSENNNTVKIMTIHKSKGLEFPVVFVSNIKKKFNFMDARQKAVILADMGIGVECFDENSRIVSKNFAKEAVVKKIQLNTIEEEMRIFYVACTRARDKLIFTTAGKSLEDFEKISSAITTNDSYLGYGNINRITSYLDILGMTLRGNNCKSAKVDLREIPLSEIFENQVKEKYLEDVGATNLENIKTEHIYDAEIKNELEKRFSFEYLYQKETKSHAKLSVSEIKKYSYDTDLSEEVLQGNESVDFMEAFAKLSKKNDNIAKDKEVCKAEEKNAKENAVKSDNKNECTKGNKIAGALRGTIYHLIFELFDYDIESDEENIKTFLDNLMEKGKISKDERDVIDVQDFLTFASTNLYERMKNAYKRGELYREAQFVVGFSSAEIDEFKRIAKAIGDEKRIVFPENIEPLGEMVLIQGIIDAYFIEDGKLVLVDYKTDRVQEKNELINHYFVQLELYKKAVEQITGKEVAEKIIYSVTLGEEITC